MADVIYMFPANYRIIAFSFRMGVRNIKNRERQRSNRRLKHKDELLDKKNNQGIKDLTAYNAVIHMVTNENEIVLR